jgi:hypothetical protein
VLNKVHKNRGKKKNPPLKILCVHNFCCLRRKMIKSSFLKTLDGETLYSRAFQSVKHGGLHTQNYKVGILKRAVTLA